MNLTQANLDDTLTHLALVALGGPQGGGLLISDVGAGGGMSLSLVNFVITTAHFQNIP